MKKYEQGFELYKKSSGKISNADIAKKLDVSDSTVRKWKSRYKWNDKLGIKKTVTPSKKQSVTKNIRDEQRVKTINALVEAGTYSHALDLLIDIYLDAYEEYENAKTNDLETEKLRKELAGLLNQLGLDIKNRSLVTKRTNKETKEPVKEQQKENKLLQFRQRMSK